MNLHPTIPLLVREAKNLAKMDIEIPIVAATLMCRQQYFTTIQDSLNVSRIFFRFCRIVKVQTTSSPMRSDATDNLVETHNLQSDHTYGTISNSCNAGKTHGESPP